MKPCRRKFLSGVGTSVVSISSLSYLISKEPNNTVSNQIRILGHRGCSATEVDNSMEGIKCAINSGANGVEIDVRNTKDNKLILSHDPYIITDNDLFIFENSELDEIQQNSSEQIVLFEDALDLISNEENFDIHVDLKSPEKITDIVSKIEDYNLSNRVMLQSWNTSNFEPISHKNIKKALVSYYPSTTLIEKASKHNIDAVIPHYTSQNLSHYAKYSNKKGIECGYWAINDTKMDVLLGIDTSPNFIITNRPKEAVSYLNNHQI
jgi:glycerophosphoryl diester phosphodiesterase